MYEIFGKRALDLLGAGLALLLLSPLLALTALAVALALGRPVLFFQERAGRGGVPSRSSSSAACGRGRARMPSG